MSRRQERRAARDWPKPDQDRFRLACEVVGLQADLKAVEDAQDQDLAAVVREFLTCRQSRYPGVTADVAKLIERMAVLSGWMPNDD